MKLVAVFQTKATFVRLPERTPPDVALAQVLIVGGLADQEVDLILDTQAILRVEVATGQLVANALDDVQSLLVQALFRTADCSQAASGRPGQVDQGASGDGDVTSVIQDVLFRGQDTVERVGALSSASGHHRSVNAFLILGPARASSSVGHRFRLLALGSRFDEPPVQQRVVDEGLEHSHEAVLVVSKHGHDGLAGAAVSSFDAGHLHGVDQHPGEAKRNLFRKLFPGHGDLEAVAEVDVKDLSAHPVQEEVGRMPVAEAEHIPQEKKQEMKSNKMVTRGIIP